MTKRALLLLLIEDNPGDVRLIQEILSEGGESGFALKSAGRLSAGLESLAAGQTDLVLLDLNLPDCLGLTTLARVQQHAEGIPIVVLTAIDDEALAMEAVKQGAQDYLVKGQFQSRTLWRVIRYAVERKRIEETLRQSEQRLREAQALGKIGNWEYDLTTQRIKWSDEVFRLYERERSLGPPSFDEEALYYKPDDARKLREYARLAAESGKDYRYETAAHLKSGREIILSVSMHPVKNESGQIVNLFGTVQDITERKRQEELQLVLYKISEAAASSVDLNDFFRTIHEILASLIPLENFYISLYHADSGEFSFPYFIDTIDEAPKPRKLKKGMTEYVFRTGQPLLADLGKIQSLCSSGTVEIIGTPPVHWLGVPLKKDGQPIGVLALQSYTNRVAIGEGELHILSYVSDQIAMAIERKRAEDALRTSLKEKDLLLREIHHRVKNNLQIISSLLNLQVQNCQDRRLHDLIKESQNRIRSMALVHEKLYHSKDLSRIDFAEYIHELVVHLYNAFNIKRDRVHFEAVMDNFFLDIATANPLALLVNELVSNALQHAFPDGLKGELRVRLFQDGQKWFHLSIKDDGRGFPGDLDFEKAETLGMQLIMMMVRQLEGTIELVREQGTEFKVTFKELIY